MIGGGICFILGGIIAVIYGNNANNDLGRQLGSFLSNGRGNPGDPFLVIGVIAIIAGAIMLIVGFVKRNEEEIRNIANRANKLPTSYPSSIFTQREEEAKLEKKEEELHAKEMSLKARELALLEKELAPQVPYINPKITSAQPNQESE